MLGGALSQVYRLPDVAVAVGEQQRVEQTLAAVILLTAAPSVWHRHSKIDFITDSSDCRSVKLDKALSGASLKR